MLHRLHIPVLLQTVFLKIFIASKHGTIVHVFTVPKKTVLLQLYKKTFQKKTGELITSAITGETPQPQFLVLKGTCRNRKLHSVALTLIWIIHLRYYCIPLRCGEKITSQRLWSSSFGFRVCVYQNNPKLLYSRQQEESEYASSFASDQFFLLPRIFP